LISLAAYSTAVAGQLSPRAGSKRCAEFAAGRYAASLALAHYGCSELVARGSDGSPLWPQGFTGSISHGAELAVAVVARDVSYQGIGVDVERLISREESGRIFDRVLDRDELLVLAAALPDRSTSELLSLGFSAKESLYKCVNRLAPELTEFEDARIVRVVRDCSASGRVCLALVKPLSRSFGNSGEFSGAYAFSDARVETLVWFRRAS
jgi:enterobactin synthetase component D